MRPQAARLAHSRQLAEWQPPHHRGDTGTLTSNAQLTRTGSNQPRCFATFTHVQKLRTRQGGPCVVVPAPAPPQTSSRHATLLLAVASMCICSHTGAPLHAPACRATQLVHKQAPNPSCGTQHLRPHPNHKLVFKDDYAPHTNVCMCACVFQLDIPDTPSAGKTLRRRRLWA